MEDFQPENSVFLPGSLFQNPGGWAVDPQFMEQMGSTCLLAHGLGHPVEDAVTGFRVPRSGRYHIYVRTRNWTSRWSERPTPGIFTVLADGKDNGHVYGAAGPEWDWEAGGVIDLEAGEHELSIHDLKGFDARFDTVLLTLSEARPDGSKAGIEALRHTFLPQTRTVEQKGAFDFVVVGGGCSGMCAALAAARCGLKVALIQDRKVLGGNNSSEVRVGLGGRLNIGKYPALGYLLNEFGPGRKGNARTGDVYEDAKKLDIVLKEKRITLILGYKVLEVEKDGDRLTAVVATCVGDYSRIRVAAPLFADCTGDANLGVLSGADWVMGREPRSRYGEPSAPEAHDGTTLGASLQWYSLEADTPQPFPDIDWGLSLDEDTAQKVHRGQWYWEVGMTDDQIEEAERIRDYGMYVAYSNWSYLKNHASYKDEYENLYLGWVCHVLGKRESRRLLGEFVLTENDLRQFRIYPDGCVSTSWYIDNHEPDPDNAARFPEPWLSRGCLTPLDYYPIPFRCFYSRNVDNLFMAGRDISVSHLALGTTRVMRTCAMMGEVVGLAAKVCTDHDDLPRDIVPAHWDELDALMCKGAGDPDLPYLQTYTLIDTTAARSEDC
ncbi:MAG: FAD-dependent oxidoreductase [Bacteroidales bacterium]|nr:FAD-dependent oxidoreductase [Bacteroidales bacterium]